MATPAPDWIPATAKLTYPSWVQRKAVSLCKRDQKRHGYGDVQQYRLAIHEAVVASKGYDHWTGEWLAWELIGTYDTREAPSGGGEHKRKYALLPSVDQRSTTSEPDVVICAWRTHDAMADMTPAELLNFCQLVINHSQQRASNA